jgi:NAD(P)-dependent dehydrogenase (short-subunit alcohol dehydrogenase family)
MVRSVGWHDAHLGSSDSTRDRSTSNIGKASAVALAAAGAHVIVSGRDDGRGAAVVAEIHSRGGRADYVRAELDGSIEASRGLAEAAMSRLGGRIDILVNIRVNAVSPGWCSTPLCTPKVSIPPPE